MIATHVRRPLGASLLVAATLAAALLPPAHIHLGADHDDHDHTAGIQHSHWAPHHHASAGAAIDDEDGRVLPVDRSALVRAASGLVHPDVVVARLALSSVPVVPIYIRRRAAGNAPRDGPARSVAALRAPPSAA